MKRILSLVIITICLNSCKAQIKTNDQLVSEFITEIDEAIVNDDFSFLQNKSILLLNNEEEHKNYIDKFAKYQKISSEQFKENIEKSFSPQVKKLFQVVSQEIGKGFKLDTSGTVEVKPSALKMFNEWNLDYTLLYEEIVLLYSKGKEKWTFRVDGIIRSNNELYFIGEIAFRKIN